LKFEKRKHWITQYTGPKPPSPIRFISEKLSVAAVIVDKSNNGRSKSSTHDSKIFSDFSENEYN